MRKNINKIKLTMLSKLRLNKISKKTIFLSIIVLLITIIGLFYITILKDLPNPKELKNYKYVPISSEIFDRNGILLYKVYRNQNRIPIKLETLPKYVLAATIAIEDEAFYRHSGVSIFGGIIRAIKDTFILQKNLQGGSTITQQLVKSALLVPDRTVKRKVREIILALWTEKIYSKNEILEMYLNQVPYGGVSYGIEQASYSYFRKKAKNLNLAESAFLAGLPQAPSAYSPYVSFTKAKNRQKEVLDRMEELKFITRQQKEKAIKQKLNIKPPLQTIKAPHFVFYVKSVLEKQYGSDMVEEGGLKIITTLDYDIQASAEAVLTEEIDKIKKLKVTNGALLITRPSTGEILSMIGSVDFFATPSGSFNVTTANRQPGSSIKPINYAIGIDQKRVTAASVFLDIKTCFTKDQPRQYCPYNYDNRFHGPVQLRFALANSYNIPAVKMLAVNGVDNFIKQSKSFLINSFKDPIRYGLSLTLGGGEVKMVEMAQAFSTFPNEGIPKKLTGVLKVEDKYGNVLYEYTDPNYVKDMKKPLKHPNFLTISGNRAISKQTAYIISNILYDNGARSAAFGSASRLVIPGKKYVSVKTGTTNDKRDNWTIGYTSNFLVTVWVGNNDNSPMHPYLTSGVTGAAPIWNRVMRMVLKDQPDLAPRKPIGIIVAKVCTDTGMVASSSNSCPIRNEFLIKGTEGVKPITTTAREPIPVNRDTGTMTKPDDPAAEMQEKTVLKDEFSSWCVDCAHPEFITPTPVP